MNGLQVNSEWEVWGNALKDWKEFSRRNQKKTLQMVLKGIPAPLRPMVRKKANWVYFFLHQIFWFFYTKFKKKAFPKKLM